MSRVPELTCPAAPAGLGEQCSLSSAARPEPAPHTVRAPAVSDRDVAGMLPACRALAWRYRARIRDHADSIEDLAQVAMIGVLKAARSWDGQHTFRAWAVLKAEREIQHHLRDSIPGHRYGRALRVVSLDAEHGDTTLHGVTGGHDDDADLRLTLAGALGRLDRSERALVVVHVVGGLSQREVAPALGIHQTRVGARVRGALARLARTPEVATLRTAA